MIRQPNAAIRPVPECQLAEHAIAWQRKAQPELRGEIQTRDAELVRFGLRRDSEAEESPNRASREYLPAP